MDKPIKDTFIRISGNMYIQSTDLGLGKDATVTCKGSIVSVQEGDNQDGTKNVKYIFKATECQVA